MIASLSCSLSDTVFYTLVEHDSIPVPVIVDNGDGSATTALSDSIQWYSNGSIAVGENDTVYIAVSYTHLPSPRDMRRSRMPSSA